MREVCFRKEDVYRGDLILVNEDFALKRQNAVQRLVPADSRYPEVLLGNRAASMLACLIREICGEAEIIPVSGTAHLKSRQRFMKTRYWNMEKALQESMWRFRITVSIRQDLRLMLDRR